MKNWNNANVRTKAKVLKPVMRIVSFTLEVCNFFTHFKQER